TDMVGKNFLDFAHPSEVDTIATRVPGSVNDAPAHFRVRLRTSNDAYRWVSVVVRDVTDPVDGATLRLAAWRDAQADVEGETARDESEARYRLLAENASDVVTLIDERSRFAWISPSVYDVVGWTSDELIGRPSSDFLLSEDLERLLSTHPSSTRDVSRASQLRFRRPDGTFQWMAARSAPTPDGVGVTGRVVALRDVTTEVEARESLISSESRFRMLAENASDVVVDLDDDGHVRWVSPSIERVL
ncbi:MAG: PAS domain-containing protein, partial [Acidimicrobiales bacterium]